MEHTHHHEHDTPQHYNRLFALVIGLNLCFAAVEAGIAWHANSASLLADAGHNLTDVASLGFAWFANWLLSRKPNPRYSYGYKRTTLLAAFINAVLLLLTGLGLLYQSIWHLMHPSILHSKIVIAVALAGTLINGITAWLFHRSQQQDNNIRGAFLHLFYDALISFAVALGGTITLYTQWHTLDPLLGITIAGVILWSTWRFLQTSTASLLDAVPQQLDKQAVHDYLLELARASAIHDLHIWEISTRDIALTAHLVIPSHTLEDHEHAQIRQALLARFAINHVTLQIEKNQQNNTCYQIHCGE